MSDVSLQGDAVNFSHEIGLVHIRMPETFCAFYVVNVSGPDSFFVIVK